MAFDVDKALRWAGLDRTKTLRRRNDADLPFFQRPEIGPPLLLDTSVYIDQMHNRFPKDVEALTAIRLKDHSTIALQELMFAAGALDPNDRRTIEVIEKIRTVISGMPTHRLHTPDADVLGRGAILAGILCRLQGYAKDDRRRALDDCVLFLQAQKLGLTVLTRNVRDYDILLQLMPSGRALFYRQIGQ